MPLLVAVVAGDLERILATGTSPTVGARRVVTGDGGRALSTLFSIFTTLLPLLLFPSLLLGGLAILGPRGIWMRGVWGGLYWAFLEEAEVFSQESRIGEASDLATVMWARQLPGGKRWSISLMMEGGWRLLIAFSIKASQLSNSLPRCSIWALTKGWRPSWKNRISSGFSGALSASNSMDWGCSRWDAQL